MTARRWLAYLSAAIAAVLAVMLPLSSASAQTPPAAGTRVGASHPQTILPVGSSHSVFPLQGRCDSLPQPGFASGLCVAAEGANSVVAVARSGDVATGASDGVGITLDQARAAAERNGIDTRLMDLNYEPGAPPGMYGYTAFRGWTGGLIRGASGRFQVTLTDLGLTDEPTAVNTIAHELQHIRYGMRTGLTPLDEGPANLSGDLAELFFR